MWDRVAAPRVRAVQGSLHRWPDQTCAPAPMATASRSHPNPLARIAGVFIVCDGCASHRHAAPSAVQARRNAAGATAMARPLTDDVAHDQSTDAGQDGPGSAGAARQAGLGSALGSVGRCGWGCRQRSTSRGGGHRRHVAHRADVGSFHPLVLAGSADDVIGSHTLGLDPSQGVIGPSLRQDPGPGPTHGRPRRTGSDPPCLLPAVAATHAAGPTQPRWRQRQSPHRAGTNTPRGGRAVQVRLRRAGSAVGRIRRHFIGRAIRLMALPWRRPGLTRQRGCAGETALCGVIAGHRMTRR